MKNIRGASPMADRKKRERGIGVIGSIILIPVLLIGAAVAWYGYCEARKAYWDRQVKQMCEKDGGATVYETVSLTVDQKKEMLDAFGNLFIPARNQIKPGSVVFSETTNIYLNKESPQVRQSEFRLIRISDKKLLAKQIIYSRVGGDFPTFGHESSFSCLDMKLSNKNFDVEKLTILFQGK